MFQYILTDNDIYLYNTKKREQGGHRRAIQLHVENEDVALFHLQKLPALHRCAAETRQLVECDTPSIDLHVAEQSERGQRSRMKATLPTKTERYRRSVAIQVGRLRLHDFGTPHTLRERLHAEMDVQVVEQMKSKSLKLVNMYASE